MDSSKERSRQRTQKLCLLRFALCWRDETSDEKHEEIRRLSAALIEKNPMVFQPLVSSSNSVKEHLKKSKIMGTWSETASLLKSDRFAPSRIHRKSGLFLNRL